MTFFAACSVLLNLPYASSPPRPLFYGILKTPKGKKGTWGTLYCPLPKSGVALAVERSRT